MTGPQKAFLKHRASEGIDVYTHPEFQVPEIEVAAPFLGCFGGGNFPLRKPYIQLV